MKLIATAILAATASIVPLKAQAPDPKAILEGARLSSTLVEMEGPLKGYLIQSRKKMEIAIFLKGKDIQFQFFENNKWMKFHMRLGDEKFELFEFINGKQVAFPREKLTEAIAGTDLTYEDLAFRFFYWPNPKLEGTENVAGQSCHRLQLNKPKGAPGRYEAVYVWVHTKYGAFMRIRGHNSNDVLVKEFQVEDVMKVGDDVWVLEKMQVATHDPKNGRRISITDLTFSKPSKGALKGLN